MRYSDIIKEGANLPFEALMKVMELMKKDRAGFPNWDDVLIQTSSEGQFFEVRDWGNWESKVDPYDFEYDELDRSSSDKLNTILQTVEKMFQGKVTLRYVVGEKCWLTLKSN